MTIWRHTNLQGGWKSRRNGQRGEGPPFRASPTVAPPMAHCRWGRGPECWLYVHSAGSRLPTPVTRGSVG